MFCFRVCGVSVYGLCYSILINTLKCYKFYFLASETQKTHSIKTCICYKISNLVTVHSHFLEYTELDCKRNFFIYSPKGSFSFLILFPFSLLSSLFSVLCSWSIVLIVDLCSLLVFARRQSITTLRLHVASFLFATLLARRRSLCSQLLDLSTLRLQRR